MLTAIPARVLHALHALAAGLLVLADLGLELLCHEHEHDGALRQLEDDKWPYQRGGYVGPGGPGLALIHPGEQYVTRDDGYDLATDLANQGLRACCGLPSAEHCL